MSKKSTCKETKTCCDLYLGTDYVLLDQVDLKVLDSLERDKLTKVILDIDTSIKDTRSDILFRTRFGNLGEGARVYRDYTFQRGNGLRTIKGSDSIKVTEEPEEIILEVIKSEDLTLTMENVGSGEDILMGFDDSSLDLVAQFRRVRSEDLEVYTDAGGSLVVDFNVYDKTSLEELKNITLSNYSEFIETARRIQNAKLL